MVTHRASSTPQMETWAGEYKETPERAPSYPEKNTLANHVPFADLASMQQRQQTTRAYSSNNIRQAGLVEPQHSPLVSPPLSRSISHQSLADLNMAQGPSQSPPQRQVTSDALSPTESKAVNGLLSLLAENSYAYGQHTELINLLHKGFVAYVYPPTDNAPSSNSIDPHSYALLREMRQAREAMDTRFAVSETIGVDWLSDEMILARSNEERIATTELCQKAVQDEPSSIKLWQSYVSWVWTNYAACNKLEGSDNPQWTKEDNEVCKELFTQELVLDVLEQAAAATQWRIDESHIIWDRYARSVQEALPPSPSPADIERLRNLFIQRLQVPHSTWSETAQMLWSIVSKQEGSDWEALMASVTETAKPAQKAMNLREEQEFKLRRAMESGDQEAIHEEFDRYLRWEKNLKQKSRTPFDYDLRRALFERALLREPTNTEWWLDYIDMVTTTDARATNSSSMLPLIERGTRHCPWSGELWARRILTADHERRSPDEIEAIKHRATNSGLLDLGGMEELVRMLQQWCSYLRRRAFSKANSEDDLDTAEVGITMALEDVQQAGKKIYGPDFQGDPLFRLEHIQIKFYTEGRRINEARDIWRQLATRRAHTFDFWQHYYGWELSIWAFQRFVERDRVETHENGPNLATAAVREALKQDNLDWPEKVLELYLYHFQQHESAQQLQLALVDARQFSIRLEKRRKKEAEDAACLSAQQQQIPAPMDTSNGDSTAGNGEKRRRDEEPHTNGDGRKKRKTEDAANSQVGYNEPASSASAQIKRDREHNTITVKNLPADIQEVDIRRFFRDCGTVLSVDVIMDKGGQNASATVEFEVHEDVLTAKTRNGKDLNGHEVRIYSGGQNTLYVTNYPAECDENAIRDLFKNYGDIVSVRFPSLKYNSRRRFCYVTFLTTEMARAAEEALDGKKLDGLHTLLAKISDPDAAKQRSGAQAEGREVFVKNIDREVPESEVKEFFMQFGKVENIKLLKLVNDQRTGSGFVVYSSTDEASAAVEEGNNKPFHDRILHIALSSAKGGPPPSDRVKKTEVIIKKPSIASSRSPEAASQAAANGDRRGSDVSMASGTPAGDDSYKTIRERKIAIFHLPDTVNDARIRSAMERYGPITKIQLRREREGAIVEFAQVKDAFNVRQGVDVRSLGVGVTTGNVGDLLAKDKKNKHGAAGSASTTTAEGTGSTSNRSALMPSSVSRAGPPRRGGGGRRGGLGFRRNAGFGIGGNPEAGGGEGEGDTATSQKNPPSPPPATASAGGGGGSNAKRSNADFRSMLERSKKEGS